MTPAHAARLAVPAGWVHRPPGSGGSDPGDGVVLAARAPSVPASGVTPEVVLHTRAGVRDDLESWRASAAAELGTTLVCFDLEDVDCYELDGWPVVYHRFSHRLGTADLISEQWGWLVDGTGVVLTCTVAREDYATWCDVFERLAATVRLVPLAA